MYIEYENCCLCPRECKVNRNKGEKGACREGADIMVGRAALHFWEEPCVSGERGSGTVFFAGCSIGCVYCQNYSLSRGKKGKKVTVDELKDIFLDLERQGAHNINLVTADHFAPGVKDALVKAKEEGLSIPVVLNTGGYIKTSVIELLQDVVDIFLTDFKYMDKHLAKKYSFAEDYPEIAKAALCKMMSIKPQPVYADDEILKEGVVVRHLCLPGCAEDSKRVIEYVYKEYGDNVILSIMSQYTPMAQCEKYPEINRKLTEKEYEEIVDYCIALGIENAYIQEGDSAEESFIPEFE